MFLNGPGLVSSFDDPEGLVAQPFSSLLRALGHSAIESPQCGSGMFSRGLRVEDLDPGFVLLVDGRHPKWCIK